MHDTFSRGDNPVYGDNEAFLQSTVAIVLLHRVVDTYAPSLSKVYYCCCLVDKFLRAMKEMGHTEYASKIFDLFTKRWLRWHHPVHTLAYHLDPSFHTHSISDDELLDCEAACKMLYPNDVADIMHGISVFKGINQELSLVLP